LIALCLIALMAFTAGPVGGADWPHWRGPDRSGVSPEGSGWPDGWPPKRLWGRNVGKGCTTPVIAGGKLFVMGFSSKGGGRGRGNDTVFCFDARSGRQLWKQTYPCRYQGRVRTGDTGGYGGPSATPSFDAATGRLYTLSVDGDLRCWDTRADGKLVWAKNLYDDYRVRQRPSVGGGKRDFGFTSSPLVWGAVVIVEVGGGEGMVSAFDKATGRRRWTSQYKQPAGHTGGLVPVKVGKLDCLAVLTLQHLLVLRLDAGSEGKTLVTYERRTNYGCNIPTPAVAGGRVLVTSEYNHKNSELVEISPRGARRVWSSKAHALVASPVIHRDRIYLVQRALQCVGCKDGKLKWRGGSFGHGSCVVTAADNKIIAFGKGRLALVEAAPKADKYRELSRVDKVVRGTCYPSVVLSDGVIACKDRDGALVCFSVRPAPEAGSLQ
jgi:outer membrane protein assembly factor BamB